jgi:hypothetical protein
VVLRVNIIPLVVAVEVAEHPQLGQTQDRVRVLVVLVAQEH